MNAAHLAPILDILRLLAARRRGVTLVLVTRPSSFPCLDLRGIDVHRVAWSPVREQVALHGADVGVAPLTRDAWTEGKCGARVLAYFAAGLPVVASPVGAQRVLVEDGVSGLIADTPADWHEAIARLAGDASLRATLTAGGRTVAERYAVERWYSEWQAVVRG